MSLSDVGERQGYWARVGARARTDIVRSNARFSLSQRWRAFRSLKVGMPWQERLERANAARKRNQERRKVEQAKAAALRPFLESTRDL